LRALKHAYAPLVALLLAGALVAGGCGSEPQSEAADNAATTTAPKPPEETRSSYKTRPDLHPPVFDVDRNVGGTAPGYIFVAAKEKTDPGGPMILDNRGQVVWFKEVQPLAATDFRVQRYRGHPVLTWWQGKISETGVGQGTDVIVDTSYRMIAEVDAGNGLRSDLHEFLITPRDTALLVAYNPVRRDLTPFHGPREGWVYDSVVQEVDIASGRVLFEWRSLEHVPLAESVSRKPAQRASRKAPFDYFHVNSVDLDDDGNYIVSARNTHTVYKLSRKGGAIMWRLGGKHSDFEMGPGTTFGYQHDARRQEDGTITVFDNSNTPAVAKVSRALVIQLDEKAKTATLVHAYEHPKHLLTPHQGNEQRLLDGHVLVTWGGIPYVTEYGTDGQVLFDGRLAIGDTYRGYRLPWEGRPKTPPAIAAEGDGGDVVVYASWNGATDVASWEVLAGPDEQSLKAVKKIDKSGFETTMRVKTDEKLVAVEALDGAGRPLGRSHAIEPS
jgi:Arylsulfotransferase (ASST)